MQNIARHRKKRKRKILNIFFKKQKNTYTLGNGFINDMLFNIPFVEKLYNV